MSTDHQGRAADDQAAAVPPTATVIPESGHPIREHQLDREALKVLYRLRDAGFKGYLVGGGVRDLYLGRTPKDFDISTDARPGQLRQLFRNSRTIGRRFRLVQVFFRGNKIIEVSTLRSSSEFDLEGQDQVLAANNTFGTLEEDAFRRDLTINALFYEIENRTIIDYIGGVGDLEAGLIRMVGDPDRRFTRDPVRILRVIRHAARTGFAIDRATLEALHRHCDKLALCPPSRIRDEILKDLQSGMSRPWADLCLSTPTWPALFPLYNECLTGDKGEAVRAQLLRIFSALDRLHAHVDGAPPVKVPEPLLFAALLLPWACARYGLPETNVRGQGFNQLSRTIRDDIDLHFGEPFNVQRMAKEFVTTLLVNLSTFHHARIQGEDPKWLRKKSYYRDCTRFYDLYLESQGAAEVPVDRFIDERSAAREVEVVSIADDAGSGRESRSRSRGGGMNPAFSSDLHGVFGLRRQRT